MKRFKIFLVCMLGALMLANGGTVAQADTGYCRLTWTVIPTPSLGVQESSLTSVTAIAANDVWAGGWFEENDTDYSLLLHWNGSVWEQVPVPDIGTITDLEVVNANDIWASGTGFLHWDGTMWEHFAFSEYVQNLSAISSSEVWGVTVEEHVVRWDGAEWTLVTPPIINLPNVTFQDIYARSSNDVWVVGWWSPGSVGYGPIVQHWDGSEWTSIPFSVSDSPILSSIQGGDGNRLWVVGEWRSASNPLVARGDSAEFDLVRTPNIYPDYSGRASFSNLHVLAPNDVWAVGRTDSSISNPLIEHWDGKKWRIETVPFLTEESEFLTDIAALNSMDVWVVGGVRGPGFWQPLVMHGSLPCNPQRPLPSRVKLLLPFDRAIVTDLPLVLTWTKTSNTSFYHLRVYQKDEPYKLIVDRRIKRREFNLKNISPFPYPTFYWEVSACNDYGCSSTRYRRFRYEPGTE